MSELRFRLVVASAGAALAMSCTADVSREEGAVVVDQTVFDFTVVADRELFELKDLEFFGTVGPYAIYEVTGDEPALDGPRVRFDSAAGGLVMLCGAGSYFAGDEGGDMTMTLYGGGSGEQELTETRVAAIVADSGCSDADDQFGERIPTEEPSGSATLYYTAEEDIRIGIQGDIPVGSKILLRLAAIDIPERDHNNANTIPRICCEGDYCTLAEAP